MNKLPRTPFLGVAYYPEDWPEAEIPRDIARMKEMGIKVIRIAEFAWHNMEPRPGEYDFSFFHRVIDCAKANGILTVMGTPTATPPRWFGRLYPDAFKENIQGRTQQHGGRRHMCSNHPQYVEYSMAIVEAMAKEFADDEAVIGWQIDNEIYEGEHSGGCFCKNCQARFQESLRKQYKTIDALNEAWGLNIFSQWYDDFSDIPMPRDAWHNPHLQQAWTVFQNESHIAFVKKQADILHKYVKVPVGTDTMPCGGMDYRDMTRALDVVQFNHYNVPESLHACSLWFDHLRTLKPRPFWNTETATCWNGSTSIGQSVKPEGFCRVNSWLPIALGAEANMYWLWRTHWAGHELMHGAVLDTSGRDMHIAGEVKQTAKEFERASEFITGTRVRTDVALHYASINYLMHSYQSIVWGWSYLNDLQDKWYAPIAQAGLRPDVIDCEQPLDGYKLIFSPMMMTLEQHALGERMMDWVKNGGVWVVGPLTDVRDEAGARYKDRYFGMLEALTGVRWRYGVPDREGRIKAAWADGAPFSGAAWYEMCDNEGADTLASVTEGHSALLGKSILTRKRVGKGEVILVGTVPSEADVKRIVALAVEDSGVSAVSTHGKVMVAPRRGDAGSGLVVVEYGNESGSVRLEKPMLNLLTGAALEGTIDIRPYDVLVLKAL